jgi:hypothetical protein
MVSRLPLWSSEVDDLLRLVPPEFPCLIGRVGHRPVCIPMALMDAMRRRRPSLPQHIQYPSIKRKLYQDMKMTHKRT